MKHHPSLRLLAVSLLTAVSLPGAANAAFTVSTNANRDTYVSSGTSGANDLSVRNFGASGAMIISGPTAEQNRTQNALLGFDTAGIKTALDAQFGVGGWIVTDLDLGLNSNFHVLGSQPNNLAFNRIAAGDFGFEWLSNDGWVEGNGGGNGGVVPPSTGITWNSLPAFLATTTRESVGSFTWNGLPPPENTNVRASWDLLLGAGIIDDIESGSLVSLLGTPASGSTVGYLFNTTTQQNPAILYVTAEAVPEPTSTALIVAGLFGVASLVRRQRLQR